MSPRRRQVLASAVGLGGAATFAGCASRFADERQAAEHDAHDHDHSHPTAARANSDEEAVVWMHQTSFDPVRLSVPPGTTVTWENADLYRHDVRSMKVHEDAEEWTFYEKSGLTERETITYTFEEAGVYEYHCHNHGYLNMCGVILVGTRNPERRLPCERTGEYRFGSHEDVHVHGDHNSTDSDHEDG